MLISFYETTEDYEVVLAAQESNLTFGKQVLRRALFEVPEDRRLIVLTIGTVSIHSSWNIDTAISSVGIIGVNIAEIAMRLK